MSRPDTLTCRKPVWVIENGREVRQPCGNPILPPERACPACEGDREWRRAKEAFRAGKGRL